MLELTVAATHRNLISAVLLDQTNGISEVHFASAGLIKQS
jgi:hypothetical protein